MELLQPWKIQIAKLNMADLYDMTEFANEVFALNLMTNGEDELQSKLDPAVFPIILSMRDEFITPAVQEFTHVVFDYTLDDFEVETNGKWIPPGEGLYPHYHPSSAFSAILYPSDSESGINFFDPRGNACRGYPKAIRDRFFAKVPYSPRAGDVLIFPSYIQHSVSYVKEDVRLSLLHEYYLRDTR